jgi:hypothetical protein
MMETMGRRTAAATVLLILMVPIAAEAADPGKPHPHQGVLTPYEAGPVEIELTEDQLKRLGEGKLVIMTIESEGGGRGLGIQDVAAPPDTVWSRIKSFRMYPEWVGPVKECEIYAEQENVVLTRTKISSLLFSYEYFLVNTLHPEYDMLTWTLDYERYSDFDDCVGAWYIEAHPEKEGWSRTWFSSDLKLRGSMPGFIMDHVKKQGLKDATSWVKRQSERAMGD